MQMAEKKFTYSNFFVDLHRELHVGYWHLVCAIFLLDEININKIYSFISYILIYTSLCCWYFPSSFYYYSKLRNFYLPGESVADTSTSSPDLPGPISPATVKMENSRISPTSGLLSKSSDNRWMLYAFRNEYRRYGNQFAVLWDTNRWLSTE